MSANCTIYHFYDEFQVIVKSVLERIRKEYLIILLTFFISLSFIKLKLYFYGHF